MKSAHLCSCCCSDPNIKKTQHIQDYETASSVFSYSPFLNMTLLFRSLYTSSYQISKLILKLPYLLSPRPCFTLRFQPAFWVIIWCSRMHTYSSDIFKSFAKYRDKIIFTCIRCSPFISKTHFGEIYACIACIFFSKKNNLLAHASFSLANIYKLRELTSTRDISMLNRTQCSCEQASMNNSAMEILYLKTWRLARRKYIPNYGAEANHTGLLHA